MVSTIRLRHPSLELASSLLAAKQIDLKQVVLYNHSYMMLSFNVRNKEESIATGNDSLFIPLVNKSRMSPYITSVKDNEYFKSPVSFP